MTPQEFSARCRENGRKGGEENAKKWIAIRNQVEADYLKNPYLSAKELSERNKVPVPTVYNYIRELRPQKGRGLPPARTPEEVIERLKRENEKLALQLQAVKKLEAL